MSSVLQRHVYFFLVSGGVGCGVKKESPLLTDGRKILFISSGTCVFLDICISVIIYLCCGTRNLRF